jgi:hypothetical protein
VHASLFPTTVALSVQRLLGVFLLGMAVLHGVILLLCAAAFKSIDQSDIYQPLTAYTLGAMTADCKFQTCGSLDVSRNACNNQKHSF